MKKYLLSAVLFGAMSTAGLAQSNGNVNTSTSTEENSLEQVESGTNNAAEEAKLKAQEKKEEQEHMNNSNARKNEEVEEVINP